MAAKTALVQAPTNDSPAPNEVPMRYPNIAFILGLFSVAIGVSPAAGQVSLVDQVDRAVLAAPETFREGATVLGYGGNARTGDPLTVLRAGSNDVICLADDPGRDGFHVACYHESLDPFMVLGRRITAAGGDRATVLAARYAALEDGEIEAPAAALWSLSASADVDPAAGGLAQDERRLSVLYVPNKDADDLGLPTRPDGDSPWLMLPGTPWAHVMIPR